MWQTMWHPKSALVYFRKGTTPHCPWAGLGGGGGGGVGVGMENSGGVLTFSCVFSPAEISREYLTPSLYLTMNSPPQQRKN